MKILCISKTKPTRQFYEGAIFRARGCFWRVCDLHATPWDKEAPMFTLESVKMWASLTLAELQDPFRVLREDFGIEVELESALFGDTEPTPIK